ncbi:MAG: DegV family protein, partial [Oscillospiraceae bacterium]
LENGGEKAETNAPAPEEYRDFFLEQLEKNDEIVHISITSKVSQSYCNAMAALELMGESGKRVRVVDSWHLSTGIGHMVIKAVEMRNAGSSSQEIVDEAERMKDSISTSFITMNANYLYRNGRVSNAVKTFCEVFMVHPVLTLKEGRMTLKSVKIGNYEKAVMRYVKGELRNSRKIDKKRLFITHAGCTVKFINAVKAQAERLCSFEEILVTKASATVSGNCGMGTVGVLFVKNGGH